MTRAPHLLLTATACTALSGTLALALAAPASAVTTGTPTIVNNETVSAQLTSSGAVDTARLFDQLVVTGSGTATVADPTSPDGLRDLDGFSAPEVRDGRAQYEIQVDGSEERRTVADFPADRLPVTVAVEYRLDGVEVAAEDVVGKTGELEVRYTVENVTAEPTDISFIDFEGKTVTKTVPVVTPYVGQLTTTLPASFRELRSNRADIAGDGRGGHEVAFTMVLFTPIGAEQHVLSYTAQVEDAELPPARIQVVPVQPERKPELAFGQRGFEEGAASAATLAGGANQVDAGLLQLQAGAGELLAGLNQLKDGADQLNAGLAGTAAPGAAELADGLDQLDAGGNELSSGLGQLSTGAGSLRAGLLKAESGSGDLSDGLGQLKDGAGDLSSGLGDLRDGATVGTAQLDAGAKELVAGVTRIRQGVEVLPTSIKENPGYKELTGGLQTLASKIGRHDDRTSATVIGGLNLLGFGLRGPAGREDGSPACNPDAEPGTLQACGGADGVELVQEALKAASEKDNDALVGLVAAAKQAYREADCPAGPDALPVPNVLPPTLLPEGLCRTSSTVVYGLAVPAGVLSPEHPGGVLAQTIASKLAIANAAGKLELAFSAVDARILPGLAAVKAGLSGDVNANGRIDVYKDPDKTDEQVGIREGQLAVRDGIDTLVEGISETIVGFLQQAEAGGAKLLEGTATLASEQEGSLLDGIGRLDAGGRQLATGLVAAESGGQALASGLGDAATGSGTLADGLVSADSGGQRLSDGLRDAADGGQRLADGLGDAADGSGQIADGLAKAAPGAQAIADGAGQASESGTKRLVAGGAASSAANAERAAIMRALGEKGAAALPYGAPEGATGTAAYDLVLAGASTEARDNTTRGVVALGLLGLASLGGLALRRRAV